MTTYTDEVNIYNPDAIEDAIEEAGQTASNFITEVSADNGIVVATAGHGTTGGAITSNTTGWHIGDVLEYIRQGISRFWIGLKEGDTTPTVRIGKASGESHMELDYHSMQLVDKEGDTYFHVSDLRGQDGIAEITDVFIGDGTTRTFSLSIPATATVAHYEVKIDGVIMTSGFTISSGNITFTSAPSRDSEVIISYGADSLYLKAYTLGTRNTGNLGAFSVVEGFGNVASGLYSYAGGYSTTASGNYAHAEGMSTTASGFRSHAEGAFTVASNSEAHAEGSNSIAKGGSSHAEGSNTRANGASSHAQGQSTIAACRAQAVLGKYNIEDSSTSAAGYGEYAVIVGNGTSTDARSNALAIDWDGNVDMAGDVRDMNGALRYAPIAYGMLSGISTTTALTTSAQKAPMDAFTGSGCSKSSNGIKVSEAGVYLISAQMYYSTGFTSGDLIHTMISKNGNTALSETVARATAASPYTVYQTGPVIAQLAAGDTVYVYVYNQTGARGYIASYGDGRGNTLTVVRIA